MTEKELDEIKSREEMFEKARYEFEKERSRLAHIGLWAEHWGIPILNKIKNNSCCNDCPQCAACLSKDALDKLPKGDEFGASYTAAQTRVNKLGLK